MGAERGEKMDEILKDFPGEYELLLQELLHDSEWGLAVSRSGGDIVVRQREENCFAYDLTLKNCKGLPDNAVGQSLLIGKLRRDGDGYVLTGDLDDLDADDMVPVELRFTGLEISAWAIRPNLRLWQKDPWQALGLLCSGIVRKAEILPHLLHDGERELLPLMNELCAINWCIASKTKHFVELRRILPRELHRHLDRIERGSGKWERRRRHCDALVKKLNSSRYEHVWRDLWAHVAQTQMAYPDQSERSPELERSITAELHRMGYAGTFPDFTRRGTIARSRFVGRHLVTRGAEAAFHIRVQVYSLDDRLNLNCLCGTELLEAGAEPGDIERCAFRDGGLRFLRFANAWNVAPEDIGPRLSLAAKRAELAPLSREERRMEGGLSNWRVFWLIFLIFGGCFSVLYTLGMALVSALEAAVFAGLDEVWKNLSAYPWLATLAGTWLLSGGVIGILMIFSTKE